MRVMLYPSRSHYLLRTTCCLLLGDLNGKYEGDAVPEPLPHLKTDEEDCGQCKHAVRSGCVAAVRSGCVAAVRKVYSCSEK